VSIDLYDDLKRATETILLVLKMPIPQGRRKGCVKRIMKDVAINTSAKPKAVDVASETWPTSTSKITLLINANS
jgi:hypothetical protein